jgi:hypothetical protein
MDGFEPFLVAAESVFTGPASTAPDFAPVSPSVSACAVPWPATAIAAPMPAATATPPT